MRPANRPKGDLIAEGGGGKGEDKVPIAYLVRPLVDV